MRLTKKLSVLIVDDDADDRDSVLEAFIENKFEEDFVFLHNADQLMSHLDQTKALNEISLILLDLNMPGLDGRDALKQIKTDDRFRHIPVIVLTTSSSPKDKIAAYKLGANCFISKPDSYSDLVFITNGIGRLWLMN